MPSFADEARGELVAQKGNRFLLAMKLLKEFDCFNTPEERLNIMAALGVNDVTSDIQKEQYLNWYKTTRQSILKAIVLSSDAFSSVVNEE